MNIQFCQFHRFYRAALLSLLMSLSLCLPAMAQAQSAPPDVCSPTFATSLIADQGKLVAALRSPIETAIATLDNAKIDFPSPSLASGKINHVTVTPNFADDLKSVCVLGYFEHRDDKSVMPLVVDHIDIVKVPDSSDASKTINAARIYFMTPHHKDFINSKASGSALQFWQRHQPVSLKLAAFVYKDGVRQTPFFGRDLYVNLSNRHSSMVAALLFALLCYLVAAAAIVPRKAAAMAGTAGIAASAVMRLRVRLHRLTPWYISGSGGKASLSQLQMLLFTLIVATLLFYQWLRTGVLENISTDLLYLIGISTAGAGGSQITDSVKKSLDPKVYDYVHQLGWFTAPMSSIHGSTRLSDLLLTNDRFDIYKFQMMMFTLVIAAYIIACGANELGSLQISATLLTLMGMSQGAYMGGKASTDTLGPLQDQLLGMQSLQAQYQASTDGALQTELAQRFAQAAQQAAVMFGNMYARDIPDAMQTMPGVASADNSPLPVGAAAIDSDAAPVNP